ncbi:hypothetical protein RB195_023161 [Necator americanus]|uniref:Adenylate kinase n=1 Tax=Necator americanus TaxID=51031 RepID=A0ABR1EI64_NECAM
MSRFLSIRCGKLHFAHWCELIPNHLALALVKAEMGRHSEASAFFLEGFPREARQVEDFEKEVKSVNMALILDYDEKTLREHMEKRGMGMEIIDQRIKAVNLSSYGLWRCTGQQHVLAMYGNLSPYNSAGYIARTFPMRTPERLIAFS